MRTFNYDTGKYADDQPDSDPDDNSAELARLRAIEAAARAFVANPLLTGAELRELEKALGAGK